MSSGLGFPLPSGLGWESSSGNFPNQAKGPSIPFLGKGLLSPLREDPATGGFQTVSDEANVAQCVRDVINTTLGERVFAEGIGTIARDMLFEESTVVSDLLPTSIRDCLDRWEPRVQFQSATATPVATSSESVQFNVRVVYVVRATNQRRSLVYPFSLTRSSE